jgi:hypothetical protein
VSGAECELIDEVGSTPAPAAVMRVFYRSGPIPELKAGETAAAAAAAKPPAAPPMTSEPCPAPSAVASASASVSVAKLSMASAVLSGAVMSAAAPHMPPVAPAPVSHAHPPPSPKPPAPYMGPAPLPPFKPKAMGGPVPSAAPLQAFNFFSNAFVAPFEAAFGAGRRSAPHTLTRSRSSAPFADR